MHIVHPPPPQLCPSSCSHDYPCFFFSNHRPFLWKGGVYVAHPLWAGDTNWIWECISSLDFDKRLMKAEYCFDRLPIQGDFKKCAFWPQNLHNVQFFTRQAGLA